MVVTLESDVVCTVYAVWQQYAYRQQWYVLHCNALFFLQKIKYYLAIN